MEKDIKQGMIDYAKWLKDFKVRYKMVLTEKLIRAMPSMDAKFEDKKLIFELRNKIEKTFDKVIEAKLEPLTKDQNPE